MGFHVQDQHRVAQGAQRPPAGRTQANFLATCKREHSRKPEELYTIIEACSYGPYLELFVRHRRPNWDAWGNEVGERVLR